MNRIKLEKVHKAYLLRVLQEGYYTYEDLKKIFPESIKEQPLFPEVEFHTKNKDKSIFNYKLCKSCASD